MTSACAICGKPVENPKLRPFCSARCKDVDLHRWLNESYRVPGPPAPGADPDEDERPN